MRSSLASRLCLFAIVLVVFASTSALAARPPGLEPPADPYADPRHDVFNPLRYIASIPLAAVGVALYFLTATAYGLLMWRYGAKYMLCVLIGGYCMAFGLAMRFGLNKHPESSGIYIVEYLFVVLSPCAFIAGDYILLGRLARHLGADEHLLIRPTRITRFFIASDVTTFLIQAAGGGISTSHNLSSQKIGSKIFLAGLALQLASFCFFTIVYLAFLFKVRSQSPEIWNRRKLAGASIPWHKDWKVLAGALLLSCIGILIRSVFRTIELSEGYAGPLATNEALFYGLDTLPLFIAVASFVFFWPGRYIDEGRSVVPSPVLEAGVPESEKDVPSRGESVENGVR